MLRDSTSFYPAFVACVLDIAQGYPKMISLDAAEVFNACKTSMQPPLGKQTNFHSANDMNRALLNFSKTRIGPDCSTGCLGQFLGNGVS